MQGTEESPGSQETVGSEEAAVETGGGSPWIASDLKENVTEGMELSPKDDFFLYVNHDWVMANDIPDGYSSYSTANEIMEEIRDKVQALLEDEELEGHEAELVRDLYETCLDWDTRTEDATTYVTDLYHDSFLLSDAAEYGTRTAFGDRFYQARKEVAVTLLRELSLRRVVPFGWN